jgi:hypothetical protein
MLLLLFGASSASIVCLVRPVTIQNLYEKFDELGINPSNTQNCSQVVENLLAHQDDEAFELIIFHHSLLLSKTNLLTKWTLNNERYEGNLFLLKTFH